MLDNTGHLYLAGYFGFSLLSWAILLVSDHLNDTAVKRLLEIPTWIAYRFTAATVILSIFLFVMWFFALITIGASLFVFPLKDFVLTQADLFAINAFTLACSALWILTCPWLLFQDFNNRSQWRIIQTVVSLAGIIVSAARLLIEFGLLR